MGSEETAFTQPSLHILFHVFKSLYGWRKGKCKPSIEPTYLGRKALFFCGERTKTLRLAEKPIYITQQSRIGQATKKVQDKELSLSPSRHITVQGSAKEWSLGCVIPASLPPLSASVGMRYKQPMDHSLADPSAEAESVAACERLNLDQTPPAPTPSGPGG